jgi:hypothetical protein
VDPVTRTPLFDTRTVVNWVARKCVEAWLQRNPGRTPEGWDDRELPPPGGYKGIRPEDMAVLRALKTTWDKKDWVWPVKDGRNWDEPDRWNGVVFEDGHVMELLFTENDVAGGVPKVIGKLTAMETLNLSHNAITSVPREIGTCAALKQLELTGNELKLLPKEIGAAEESEDAVDSRKQTRFATRHHRQPDPAGGTGRELERPHRAAGLDRETGGKPKVPQPAG